jgi:O-antigen ligase
MSDALIWAAVTLAAGLLVPILVARPVWGLYILLVLLTVVPARGVVSILDNHLMPVDLFMMSYAVLWVWHKGVTGASPRISPLLAPLALVVFVRFLSVLATPGLILDSLISFLKYVEWLFVFVIILDVARRRDAIRLVMVFLAVMGAQSLISVGQASWSAITGQETIARGGTLGYVGTLLGWLQLFAILIGFSLSHRARESWTRLAWWLYTVVVGVGLISTLGRTAWITGIVALLAYQWLDHTASVAVRVRRTFRYFVTATAVLAMVFFVNRTLLGVAVLRAASFSSLGETFSWLERLTLWKLGLEMFVHHPILGVGTGNYADLLGSMVGSESAYTAHNAVIGVLSETGLVGFLVYVYYVVRVVAVVRRELRANAESDLYPLLLPLGSTIIALLVADWFGWTSFLVWSIFFLGIFMVLAREGSVGSGHENLLLGERG